MWKGAKSTGVIEVTSKVKMSTRMIYWTARKTGAVYRTDMDENKINGSELVPIVSGIQSPIRITIDRVNDKLYYTEVIISSHYSGTGSSHSVNVQGRF
jgi:hypothetical protein